jgi:hypothetical protein
MQLKMSDAVVSPNRKTISWSQPLIAAISALVKPMRIGRAAASSLGPSPVPEYLAPGVFVEEVSYRSKAIEGVSTSAGGFAAFLLGVLLGLGASIAMEKARRMRRRPDDDNLSGPEKERTEKDPPRKTPHEASVCPVRIGARQR